METLILIAGGISTMLGYGIYIYFQSEDEVADRQKRFEQREKVYLKPSTPTTSTNTKIERPDTNTKIDRW